MALGCLKNRRHSLSAASRRVEVRADAWTASRSATTPGRVPVSDYGEAARFQLDTARSLAHRSTQRSPVHHQSRLVTADHWPMTWTLRKVPETSPLQGDTILASPVPL